MSGPNTKRNDLTVYVWIVLLNCCDACCCCFVKITLCANTGPINFKFSVLEDEEVVI